MQTIHNTKTTEVFRKSLRKNLTPPERIFWHYIRNKQLGYKFRRQHSVGQYIVDFYCPALYLIIELDGDSHTEIQQMKKDKVRTVYFEKLNYKVKRYYNRDIVNNIEGVMENLMNFIKELE